MDSSWKRSFGCPDKHLQVIKCNIIDNKDLTYVYLNRSHNSSDRLDWLSLIKFGQVELENHIKWQELFLQLIHFPIQFGAKTDHTGLEEGEKTVSGGGKEFERDQSALIDGQYMNQTTLKGRKVVLSWQMMWGIRRQRETLSVEWQWLLYNLHLRSICHIFVSFQHEVDQ